MINSPYWVEARIRLVRTLKTWFLITLPFVAYAPTWFDYLSTWLHAPTHLISTTVTAGFLIPLKLAALTGLGLVMPWAIYEIWSFIQGALYPTERRWAARCFMAAPCLFYAGAFLAMVWVAPWALAFFVEIAPERIAVWIDITHYWSFVMSLGLAFGFSFQLPLVILLALKLGWVDIVTLKRARPYVVVLCFIFGMLLTPPDVISQICLAVPLWLLFEASLWIGRPRSDAKTVEPATTD